MEQYWVGDCKMFRVEATKGKTAKLVVTGESNLLPYIKTSIARGQLEISLREYIKPTRPIVVVAVDAIGKGADPRQRSWPNQTFGGFGCMMDSTFDFSGMRK